MGQLKSKLSADNIYSENTSEKSIVSLELLRQQSNQIDQQRSGPTRQKWISNIHAVIGFGLTAYGFIYVAVARKTTA